MLVRRGGLRVIVGGVAVLVLAGAMTGCNTVRGVGEDITDASDATKHAITGDGGSSSSSSKGGSESKNRD